MLDSCLEPGKFEALKMRDLQTKSTIDSDNIQVQHQATNQQLNIGFGGDEKKIYRVGGRLYFIKMLKLRSRYIIIIATFWDHI